MSDDKKLRRYFVSYDLVVAGVVEIQAESAEDAERQFMEWDIGELEVHTTGPFDLLTDSVNVSDEGEA